MVGQEKFLNALNKIKDFPHSVILLGDYGSEFDEVLQLISDKIDAPLFDLCGNLKPELIDEIMTSQARWLNYICIDTLTEKDQNILLKLFEEPGQQQYLLLYGSAENSLLETIRSRGYIMRMDKYSSDQLKPLIKSVVNDQEVYDIILSICDTPNLIHEANYADISKLKLLCDTIYTSMSRANVGNALKIANKINFSDEYGKFSLQLFIRMLAKVYLDNKDYTDYQFLTYFARNVNQILDKKRYFENLILKLWENTHNSLMKDKTLV